MVGEDQEVNVGDEVAEAHLLAPGEAFAGADIRQKLVGRFAFGDCVHLGHMLEGVGIGSADHRDVTAVLPLHGGDQLLDHFVME